MTAIAEQSHAVSGRHFPGDRCGCGHTHAAHDGRTLASRDQLGRPLAAELDIRYPDACSIIVCGCEIFRGEADR